MNISRIILLFILAISTSALSKPSLAFTDLKNGPSTGLGDGLGSGAIVTIWGHDFSEQPGRVILENEETNARYDNGYIYYWKRADGQAPGGPANLYESHLMHEVAFSIPSDAPLGKYRIIIENSDGQQSLNSLPFIIREGRIRHVMSTGDNKVGDGTFDNPWAFVNGRAQKAISPGRFARGLVQEGDILYVHGVIESIDTYQYADGFDSQAIVIHGWKGTPDNNMALVSYPGTTAVARGDQRGISIIESNNVVVSKYQLEAGSFLDPNDDSPVLPNDNSSSQISGNENGRIVGNLMIDKEGWCSSGMAGAVVANGLDASGLEVVGNHIFDVGCRQTSHFHHTVYLTIRSSANLQIEPWSFTWNYFEDNKARNGIHMWDEVRGGDTCSDFVPGSTVKITNNVVVNQRGAGIFVGSSSKKPATGPIPPCWNVDFDISGNVLYNVGLGPVAEERNGTGPYGIHFLSGINGTYRIKNNLIYRVSDESSREYMRGGSLTKNEPAIIAHVDRYGYSNVEIENNIAVADYEMPFYTSDKEALKNKGNVWYVEGNKNAAASENEISVQEMGSAESLNPEIKQSNYIFSYSKSLAADGGDMGVGLGIYGGYIPNTGVGPLGSRISPPKAPDSVTVE